MLIDKDLRLSISGCFWLFYASKYKKKLRAILWVKYQIKDNDVFERAYQYIEMYY